MKNLKRVGQYSFFVHRKRNVTRLAFPPLLNRRNCVASGHGSCSFTLSLSAFSYIFSKLIKTLMGTSEGEMDFRKHV
jgi:hypothetical protein